MFSRILAFALIAGAGYWYWSGPYQRQYNPSAEQKLQEDIARMRDCIRGKNYTLGATGVSDGDPQQVCAGKFRLYEYEGEWRSLDELDE